MIYSPEKKKRIGTGSISAWGKSGLGFTTASKSCPEDQCRNRFDFLIKINIVIRLVNIIKNLLCLFFIEWFYNDVQSSKAFDTRGILTTPASDVHERLKTNGTAIKIAKETTNNQ